ncbi:MAG: GNAT family N-acetyltransferase [Christensenellales bacterium]
MKPRYKIGMRTVKTVVAVGVCLLTFQLLKLEDDINGVHAALAAVICMKSSLQHSLRTGIDRIIGTVLGSVIGVLFLLAAVNMPPLLLCLTSVFGVLLIIYLCNVLRLQASVPISIVVFLIILISKHDANPLYYGLARLAETVFGIFVAYLTNRFLGRKMTAKPAVYPKDANADGIREYLKEDIAPVMSVWLNAMIEAHPFIDSEHWHGIYEKTRDSFKTADRLLVYTGSSRILGFVCFSAEGEISGLCVSPKAQRSGIGTALIDSVKTRFLCLSVSVYKRNDAAVKFLQNRGFFAEIQKNGEYIMEWSKKSRKTGAPPSNKCGFSEP